MVAQTALNLLFKDAKADFPRLRVTGDRVEDRKLHADYIIRLTTACAEIEDAFDDKDNAYGTLLLRLFKATTEGDAFDVVKNASDAPTAHAALRSLCGYQSGIHGTRDLKRRLDALTWRNFSSGSAYAAEARALALLMDVENNGTERDLLRVQIVDGISSLGGAPSALANTWESLLNATDASIEDSLNRIVRVAGESGINGRSPSALAAPTFRPPDAGELVPICRRCNGFFHTAGECPTDAKLAGKCCFFCFRFGHTHATCPELATAKFGWTPGDAHPTRFYAPRINKDTNRGGDRRGRRDASAPASAPAPAPASASASATTAAAAPILALRELEVGDGVACVMSTTGCVSAVSILTERPPLIDGYIAVGVDTMAQVHVLRDESALSPHVSGPPNGSESQPTALLAGAVNEHVVTLSGTFFGALLNDVVIAIRNVNVAPTFGVNVLSYGILREQGVELHLEGSDNDLYLLVPTRDGGHERVDLVSYGRLFWFYVKARPDLAQSNQSPAAEPVVCACLRSYPPPPAPAKPATPDRPAPRLAQGLKHTWCNLAALTMHPSNEIVAGTAKEYGLKRLKPEDRTAISVLANVTKAPTYKKSRTLVSIAPGARWQIDLIINPAGITSIYGSNHIVELIHLESGRTVDLAVSSKGFDDIAAALRFWYAAEVAHGHTPLLLISDAPTGEFHLASDSRFDQLMLELGIAHEARTTEARVDAVEGAHRRLQEGMRVAFAAAPTAPPNRWDDVMLCVNASLNLRAGARPSSTRRCLGYVPDVSAWLPFWTLVVVHDAHRADSVTVNRGILARYLSPAFDCGVGAIRVLVNGRDVRRSRSFRVVGSSADEATPAMLASLAFDSSEPVIDAVATVEPPVELATPENTQNGQNVPTGDIFDADRNQIAPASRNASDALARSQVVGDVPRDPGEDAGPRDATPLPDQLASDTTVGSNFVTPPAGATPTPTSATRRSARQRRQPKHFDPGIGGPDRAWVGATYAHINRAIALVAFVACVFIEVAPFRASPSVAAGIYKVHSTITAAVSVGTACAIVAEYATDATGRYAPTDDATVIVDSLHDSPPPPAPPAHGDAPRRLLDVARGGMFEEWIEAIDAERLDDPSIFHDGVAALELVDVDDAPLGSLIRRSDMLTDIKHDGRRKCRWVCDGSQRAPLNPDAAFDATNAPCALKESILMCYALSAFYGWKPISRDVTKAYLQCYATKTYYVRFPPGFYSYLRYKHNGVVPFDPREKLLRVVKNLYGDEDAAHLWMKEYSSFLLYDVGCARSPIDPMLFVLRRGTHVVIHAAHVDDGLTTGDPELVEYLDARIAARFPSKRTDGDHVFVGLQYEHLPDDRIKVHQGNYAAKLVKQHGYADSRPVATPLTDGWKASDVSITEGAPSSRDLRFDSALGGVGYLTFTRPELKYFYGVLTTVAMPSLSVPDAPRASHYLALARGLRYIAGTLQRGLIYDGKRGIDLEVFKDASFAGEIHGDAKGNSKSRSGYCIMLCGAAIATASARQTPIAISTPEAEAYALMLCVRAVLCVRRLLSFMLGTSLPVTTIFEDNDAVIQQLKKRDLSARARHHRLNFGFILKAQDDGEIRVIWKKTGEMVADVFTKMDYKTFQQFADYASGN